MKRRPWGIAAGGLLLLATSGRMEPSRAVAFTFDDLPAVTGEPGPLCDAAAIQRVTDGLVRAIRLEALPATGFVNEGRVCEALRDSILPRALGTWLDAGLDLGNHTYSHFDLNRTPLADYLADIVRGETVTRRMLAERGRKLRYFRHPYLRTGADSATKRQLARFLERRGYTVAPVTLDNQEWIFAFEYARARRESRSAGADSLAAQYLEYMERVVAYYEDASRRVFGREPPQVLLLHANELNADHLGALAAIFRRRGYRFITLDEALADPVYREQDPTLSRRGRSWVLRWAERRGVGLPAEPADPVVW